MTIRNIKPIRSMIDGGTDYAEQREKTSDKDGNKRFCSQRGSYETCQFYNLKKLTVDTDKIVLNLQLTDLTGRWTLKAGQPDV